MKTLHIAKCTIAKYTRFDTQAGMFSIFLTL